MYLILYRKSYSYYTGKVLHNSTLDLTETFYNAVGICSSILMSACGQIVIKNAHLSAKGTHSSTAVCPLTLECVPGLTPSDTPGVLQHIRFPMKLIKKGLEKRH